MKTHVILDESQSIWAEKYKILLYNNIRLGRIKYNNKHRKRERDRIENEQQNISYRRKRRCSNGRIEKMVSD